MAAMPLLRDLVHERTGVYSPTTATTCSPIGWRRSCSSAASSRFSTTTTCSSTTHAPPVEWGRLMDALSVPETYFWREADQMQAVVDHVVPSLVRAHPDDPLRFWSVPCATGEEPLTIAMMLEHAGWFARVAIEIHASDASPAAIARAQAGAFGSGRSAVCRRSCATILPAGRRRLGRRPGAPSARHVVVRREPDGRRGERRGRACRSSSAGTYSFTFPIRRPTRRRPVRERDAGARAILCVGAVGVAAPRDDEVRPRRDRAARSCTSNGEARRERWRWLN